MSKVKFIFLIALLILVAGFEANAQTAYGISIVRYNTNTRLVDGYSGTWLDYYAGLYYDPEVRGDLYRTDNPETSLDSGYSVGWADIMPAEVYLSTSNFQEGRTYCTFSQHFVLAYFYYVPTNYWFDPFRYSSFIYTGGGPWGGYPFSYYYVPPRRYRLGWTQACIQIPFPPTPTPTPPPTPTPTPPPCDLNLGECQGENMDVRVSPLQIRPSGVTGGNKKAKVTVRVTNWAGQPVANREVSLSLVLRPQHRDYGGHISSLHTGNRPLGSLDKMRGVTDSNGYFVTYYSPSHISGVVGIDGSSIRAQDRTASILVGITSLEHLQPGENYHLVGVTGSHPQSHYGTSRSVNALRLIANDYKTQFYGNNPIPENDKIAYNDMSLIWGGKFELRRDWKNIGPHSEHREGINTDLRCCTNPGFIPRNRWTALNIIFRTRGSNRTKDETGTNAPHWHLRFEQFLEQDILNSPLTNLYPNVLRNPAPISTHYFVQYVFDAIFYREATQEEWEFWTNQIVEAKAQGPGFLLEKAKMMEREFFSSSEYSARNRTNEEFIIDVFEAHLMREPSQDEKSYWLSYLQSLPPSLPMNRKRARLIEQFQLSQEFEDIILNIIDMEIHPDALQEP